MSQSIQNKVPIAAFVAFIDAPKKEVLAIAENWLQNRETALGWVWTQRVEDKGYLLEVHHGGEGKAYLPTIIKDERGYGVIPCSEYTKIIEFSGSSVRILHVDHGDEDLDDGEPSEAIVPMTPLILDSTPYFLSASLLALFISLGVLLMALAAREPVNPLVVNFKYEKETPLQWWDANATWSRIEKPIALEFGSSTGWVLTKQEGAAE